MPLVDSVANEMETPPDELTSEQRAWVAHSAELWKRAHAIVNGRPDLDVSDVYHALRTLELPRPSDFDEASPVSDFVLTPAERALLQAFDALRVRYLLVGMGAALVQGAHGATQDLDLWFGSIDPARLGEAERVIASKRAANRAKDLAQLPLLEAALAARAKEDL